MLRRRNEFDAAGSGLYIGGWFDGFGRYC